MEDYEKFDQLIENLEANGPDGDLEFDSLMQIVQGLKENQPHPSAAARMRSERMMLAESKTVRESSKAQRISFIGSLYGWAVPAILMLAVVGVVFGNSNRDGSEEPATVQSGSGVLATSVPTEPAQETESSSGVEILPEPTSTLTVTMSLTRNIPIEDGPAAEPIPAELVPYPSPQSESESSRASEPVTMPDGEGGEIPVPPERPLPGSGIEPPEGSDAEQIVTPRPGDGREDGRNPDS